MDVLYEFDLSLLSLIEIVAIIFAEDPPDCVQYGKLHVA